MRIGQVAAGSPAAWVVTPLFSIPSSSYNRCMHLARTTIFRLSCCRWAAAFLGLVQCIATALGVDSNASKNPVERPNIVFILADDLGYGELGCYGQTLIQTPNLDRLAAEGMKFRQFYAGATVCAPSRSVLMTGQHHGHTRVRGNAAPEGSGPQRLTANDTTVAKVLQQAGYTTALIGKWGLGMPGDEGIPNRQGFDQFFGFLSQHHAHNHFPDYLWRNETRVPLPNGVVPVGTNGGGYATNRVVSADELFADEAIKFIDLNRAKPFFLYLSFVIPHANNERTQALKDGTEVPDLGLYKDKDWTPQNRGQAAMVTQLDTLVGRVVAHLNTLGLSKNTLVIFTSDNGPHRESRNDPEFFAASGPHRGIKRALTDGGIRVPFIARWPGKIAAGAVSDHVGYFGDFMATAAELAKAPVPEGLDSITIAPTLFGRAKDQAKHRFLYWEFHEGGFKQAALLDGRWKGLRLKGTAGPIELYDLSTDSNESGNIAATRPEIVKQLDEYLRTARSESEFWPIKEPKATAAQRPQ